MGPVHVIGNGGEKLLKHKKRYDTLVSINVLEHVENALDYLMGLFNVLKEGGILVFHERYYRTPEEGDLVLGRNLYHPIRVSKRILDLFLSKFEILFENKSPNFGGRKAKEMGYYIVARKMKVQLYRL